MFATPKFFRYLRRKPPMITAATHDETNTIDKSILIIDDDEIIVDLLTTCFEMNGLKVFRAYNGIEGWSVFQKELPYIVLTDIEMPGIDGCELASRIRNHSPYRIVAIMTGGHGEVGENLVRDGIADYRFHKPFALSYVCKMLAEEVQIDR
jgi:DNA-binding response OmpR family regulator